MHKGIEETGRLLRYRCLARLIRQLAPAYIVTGHHADDYLESVLLHWLRGAGPNSLRTLPLWSQIVRCEVFRPLLQLSRQQIRALVDDHHIPFHEDPSNQSSEFIRNRLRRKIIPLLQQEGLDSVKIWQNFHQNWEVTFQLPRPNDLADYLCLDRRLFGLGLPIKAFFDSCFKRLGLEPANRYFLSEIRTQLQRGPQFRLYYKCKQFHIWSNTKGPLWLFSTKSRVFQSFHVRFVCKEAGHTLWEVCYNHARHIVKLAAQERITSFKEGMRVPLAPANKGESKAKIFKTKKLKKIFQEAALPPPVRQNLPIVWNIELKLVTKVLFSFWEEKKDRSFI